MELGNLKWDGLWCCGSALTCKKTDESSRVPFQNLNSTRESKIRLETQPYRRRKKNIKKSKIFWGKGKKFLTGKSFSRCTEVQGGTVRGASCRIYPGASFWDDFIEMNIDTRLLTMTPSYLHEILM